MANSAINLYTNVLPGVIYRVINKIYGEEHYQSLSELFQLANLIDMGITNYYDMSGCLNLEYKYADRVKINSKGRKMIKLAFPWLRISS